MNNDDRVLKKHFDDASAVKMPWENKISDYINVEGVTSSPNHYIIFLDILSYDEIVKKIENIIF